MARKRNGLSDRHRKILAYLDEYLRQFGFPPSIREIGDKTGISSTSVVNYYLAQLETQGYIEREKNKSRGIRIVKHLAGIRQAAVSVMEDIETTFLVVLPYWQSKSPICSDRCRPHGSTVVQIARVWVMAS